MKEPYLITISESTKSSPILKSVFSRLNIKNIMAVNNFLEIKSAIRKAIPDLIIADFSSCNETKILQVLDILKSAAINIPLIVITPAFSFEIKNELKSFKKFESFIMPVDIVELARSINKIVTQLLID